MKQMQTKLATEKSASIELDVGLLFRAVKDKL
jgi:hypothetical protein